MLVEGEAVSNDVVGPIEFEADVGHMLLHAAKVDISADKRLEELELGIHRVDGVTDDFDKIRRRLFLTEGTHQLGGNAFELFERKTVIFNFKHIFVFTEGI